MVTCFINVSTVYLYSHCSNTETWLQDWNRDQSTGLLHTSRNINLGPHLKTKTIVNIYLTLMTLCVIGQSKVQGIENSRAGDVVVAAVAARQVKANYIFRTYPNKSSRRH